MLEKQAQRRQRWDQVGEVCQDWGASHAQPKPQSLPFVPLSVRGVFNRHLAGVPSPTTALPARIRNAVCIAA